jgi:hypothetical protein
MKTVGTYRRGAVTITGTLLIGAAGVLTSFACEAVGTTGIVKTSAKTGRYTVTFLRKYRNLRVTSLVLTGPADAALTATDGCILSVRNVTGNGFDIQASQVSLADANPTNGNSINFTCEGQLL